MTRRRSAAAVWEHVTFVRSSEKPVDYAIERRPDGAYRCACESFRFTRGAIGSPEKVCKHLREYLGLGAVAQLATRTAPVQVTRNSEVFTFRRAISFEPLSAS